jgi:hypothetical protein
MRSSETLYAASGSIEVTTIEISAIERTRSFRALPPLRLLGLSQVYSVQERQAAGKIQRGLEASCF